MRKFSTPSFLEPEEKSGLKEKSKSGINLNKYFHGANFATESKTNPSRNNIDGHIVIVYNF